MGGFDIVNPLEIRYSGTSRPFIELYRTDASNVNIPPSLTMGKNTNDYYALGGVFDAAGSLVYSAIVTKSSGGASAAGFGDFVFFVDLVEKMRLTASGYLSLAIGASINDIDISIAAAPTDAQLLTAQAIKEAFLYVKETSFIDRIACNLIYVNRGTSTLYGGEHVREFATGTVSIGFSLQPPDWMYKYAIDNSKIITITTLDINWDDTVAADYITRVRAWHKNWDNATATAIYDNATDLGNGTISFRNDTINVTDKVIERGDWIFLLCNVVQGTSQSCGFHSLTITYTLT